VGLRVARLFFIIGAVVAAYAAYDQLVVAGRLRTQTEALSQQVTAYLAASAETGKAPIVPLKTEEEALDDLLTHLIDGTDLLGSSVRLGVPKDGLKWEPVRFGVIKTKLTLSSAADAEASLGYFAILWKMIGEQPCRVSTVRIQAGGDTVSFDVEVELFALNGDNR
jgi:hypothetical protein